MAQMFRDARRRFLGGLAGAGVVSFGALEALDLAFAQEARSPTPECGDGEDPTPRQTAGPYFLPDSPLRSNLRDDGIVGEPLTLEGHVLSRSCRPVPNALVDIWHADGDGRYDLEGYRLRGHQFTDQQGRYSFETVLPGLYPGRTRHFHVRVQAPNRPILTTQLYLPREPANGRDRIFRPELLVRIAGRPRETALFDVVLDLP